MANNFDPASQSTATSIPYLRINLSVAKVLSDPEDPDSPLKNVYTGDFDFDILDQDGVVMDKRNGNLVPHLTDTQKTNLKNFLDSMMTKAEGTLA